MAKAKSILSSKTCANCSTEKPLSGFHRLKDGAGGVRGVCKSCATDRDRGYRSRRAFDPSVMEKPCTKCRTVKPRADFAKGEGPGGLHSWCRACSSAHARAHRATGSRFQGERVARWKQQGINATWDDYQALMDAQGGRCAICDRTEEEVGRSHALDHNHDTGEPRGILCTTCNSAIGLLWDSPDVLRRALTYLEASS